MLAAQSRLGRPLPELDIEPLPDELYYLWVWFVDLSNARQDNQAISYLEINAWASLMHIQLDLFEVRAIKALDTVFLSRKRKA